jgi:hypothetical protein
MEEGLFGRFNQRGNPAKIVLSRVFEESFEFSL